MIFYGVSMNVVYQEAFLPATATVQGQVETNQAPKNERNASILADIQKVTSDDLDEEIVVPCRHRDIRHRERNFDIFSEGFSWLKGTGKLLPQPHNIRCYVTNISNLFAFWLVHFRLSGVVYARVSLNNTFTFTWQDLHQIAWDLAYI